MARLTKSVVEARETEVVEAFKGGSKPKEVNDALYTKYTKRMGLKRLYELYHANKPVNTAGAEQA